MIVKNISNKVRICGLVTSVLLFASVSANAAIINTVPAATPADVNVIPGLTGFQTTGAMMDGMTVTATFSDGTIETQAWADLGPTHGGVRGASWSLTQMGDTFDENWMFRNSTGNSLTGLSLDGSTGFTVFDTFFNGLHGTDDSYNGTDFLDTVDSATTVTYSEQVAIEPNAPVGDLWNMLDISFGNGGIMGNFAFVQDTDNDSRFLNSPVASIPEPATLALLGLGVLGLRLGRGRASKK